MAKVTCQKDGNKYVSNDFIETKKENNNQIKSCACLVTVDVWFGVEKKTYV